MRRRPERRSRLSYNVEKNGAGRSLCSEDIRWGRWKLTVVVRHDLREGHLETNVWVKNKRHKRWHNEHRYESSNDQARSTRNVR